MACASVSAIEVTDLGTLGGDQSIAYGINAADQIIGISETADGGETHIFLYDQGVLIDVGKGVGNDINNLGQIAANLFNNHAGILGQGTITDLGALDGPYSAALSLNDHGKAVGYYAFPFGFHHAFVYDQGTMTALGPFGPEAVSVATGINESGIIVGFATDSFLVPYRAFLYSYGEMLDISPFGSSESYAHSVNNQGQAVGEYFNGTGFNSFIYSEGVFTDIGNEGSPATTAWAINDAGQVTGSTWVLPEHCGRECNLEPHAFLFHNGVFTDLNTLLPPDSGWLLAYGFAINAKGKGRIVGAGYMNGQLRAFLIRL